MPVRRTLYFRKSRDTAIRAVGHFKNNKNRNIAFVRETQYDLVQRHTHITISLANIGGIITLGICSNAWSGFIIENWLAFESHSYRACSMVKKKNIRRNLFGRKINGNVMIQTQCRNGETCFNVERYVAPTKCVGKQCERETRIASVPHRQFKRYTVSRVVWADSEEPLSTWNARGC